MHKFRTKAQRAFSLAALTLIVIFVQSTKAATEAFTVSLPSSSSIPTGGSTVDAVAFPTFDSNLGTLQGVNITVNPSYVVDVTLEANPNTSSGYEFHFTGTPSLFVTEPSNESVVSFSSPQNFGFGFSPAYTFNGPYGPVYNPAGFSVYSLGAGPYTGSYYPSQVAGTYQYKSLVTEPQLNSSQTFVINNLSPYETDGAGSSDLSFYFNDPTPSLPSPYGDIPPAVVENLAALSGNFVVTYTYTSVPEPGVLPVLCIGIVSLMRGRYRKLT